MTTLDNITPYPKRAEDATAEALARYHAAFTQLHHGIALAHPNKDTSRHSMTVLGESYAVTYLLRELEERAGTKQADEVARLLWKEWDDGSGMGSDVWSWLLEYGVNPEQIEKLTADLISKDIADAQGDEAPIVLERPVELGIEGDDEENLVSLTTDGIRIRPPCAAWFDLDPAEAREWAAHLAAMADAAEQAKSGAAR